MRYTVTSSQRSLGVWLDDKAKAEAIAARWRDLNHTNVRVLEDNGTATPLVQPRRLTKCEGAEVRSLVDDGGYTRAEAEAWVRQFGGAT